VRSFRPSRAPRIWSGTLCLALLGTAATSGAQPETPAAGSEALARARAAWAKGDFDVAEPLYKKAILAGGLTREDVVDAYVHVGATRAILGKGKPALEAFRSAATLDLAFEVPPEAGKKAEKLASQAKREKARFGALSFTADVPTAIDAGASLGVDAKLDGAHVATVTKVRLVVRDPLTSKSYSTSQPPSAVMHFDVPASLTLPNASLVVRLDALDGHDNRLATSEAKVKVGAATNAVSSAPSRSKTREDDKARESEGFWSGPWPWVIGGAIVAGAAGGSAWYFTRPTDDVSVGAPRVQALH
jgi:hypothetical protein